MNERQKKIMVPYEEPTDTCPDCSEHPCDCGLPAGYQSDIRFACNFAPHIKVMEASKVAQIIEQRDRLAEALKKLADCDWVITLPDRMDAVRSIARDVLAAAKGGSDES